MGCTVVPCVKGSAMMSRCLGLDDSQCRCQMSSTALRNCMHARTAGFLLPVLLCWSLEYFCAGQ